MPKQNAAVSYIYIVNTLLKPDHPGSTSDVSHENFSATAYSINVFSLCFQLNDSGMSGGMGKIVSTLNR